MSKESAKDKNATIENKLRKLNADVEKGRDELMVSTERLENGIRIMSNNLIGSTGLENSIMIESANIERLISSFETNTFMACKSLEEVSNHMSKFELEQLEEKAGEDINAGISEDFAPIPSHVLENEMKTKFAKSVTKMNEIFGKMSKQYGSLISNVHVQMDYKNSEKIENEKKLVVEKEDVQQLALIPSMRNKILQLKRELEISEIQARSLLVQRYVFINCFLM